MSDSRNIIGLLYVAIGRSNLVCCAVLGILIRALTNGYMLKGQEESGRLRDHVTSLTEGQGVGEKP